MRKPAPSPPNGQVLCPISEATPPCQSRPGSSSAPPPPTPTTGPDPRTRARGGTVGTPPGKPGTQGGAVFHDGFTSVYTVDNPSGHLQETFLAALCAPSCAPGQGWATQDLSATVGTPSTKVTPGAVFH